MKLTPNLLVKHLPPKLRELAVLRMKEQNKSLRGEDYTPAWSFTFAATPEKHDFWWAVQQGKEIPDHWGEEIYNYQIF